MVEFQLLDRALAKVFEPSDPVVLDEKAFDALIEPMLSKRTFKENVHAYLASSSTSPRILAMLIYSQAGNDLLTEWVEEKNMPVDLLYRSMVFDGAGWVKLNAQVRPSLAEKIVSGSDNWDFGAAEFLGGIAPTNAFPGCLKLLVERARRQGRLGDVFRRLPLDTIALYLEVEPDVFRPEVEALTSEITDLINPDYYFEDLTKCLIRAHLERTEAIAKVLGSKV